MITTISQLEPAHNFFMTVLSICYCRSHVFERPTFYKDLLAVFILWCPMLW